MGDNYIGFDPRTSLIQRMQECLERNDDDDESEVSSRDRDESNHSQEDNDPLLDKPIREESDMTLSESLSLKDQEQLEKDKQALYRHPLFPLLGKYHLVNILQS